jgi:putative Mg2+ transporter-C (MgtC) family protein
MSLQLQAETFLLVLVAAFLSMIIGLERERRDHPAGLRTHMLVGIGSCLFTIASIHAFPGADAARVASQILPGIGFLGAGAILKQRFDIRGLTTAASIWATAAVGLTVGTGAWLLALATTLLMWIVLDVLARMTHKQEKHNRVYSDDQLSREPTPSEQPYGPREHQPDNKWEN